MRIEGISLVVVDLEVAANYYEHLLGLLVNRTADGEERQRLLVRMLVFRRKR
jgi:catechol-2,3-dioxygenase